MKLPKMVVLENIKNTYNTTKHTKTTNTYFIEFLYFKNKLREIPPADTNISSHQKPIPRKW